ncbi:hypothetical protein [Vibrio sinaloensis]|nr:hypothetical protein [Vibrio sinaloensis]
MQNNYVKELAIKSYQEEAQKEFYRTSSESFHTPSFMIGIIVSSILMGWY